MLDKIQKKPLEQSQKIQGQQATIGQNAKPAKQGGIESIFKGAFSQEATTQFGMNGIAPAMMQGAGSIFGGQEQPKAPEMGAPQKGKDPDVKELLTMLLQLLQGGQKGLKGQTADKKPEQPTMSLGLGGQPPTPGVSSPTSIVSRHEQQSNFNFSSIQDLGSGNALKQEPQQKPQDLEKLPKKPAKIS